MEGEGRRSGTQILVIPYPLQGHMNPMLQFSKRLASKGLSVTFCTPTSIGNSVQTQASNIGVTMVSDGFSAGEKVESVDIYLERYRPALTQSVTELLLEHSSFKFMVYDSIMPWVLDIARLHGLGGAAFFTQSCSVSAVFYHVHHGLLDVNKLPLEVTLPSMPLMGFKDLPSFVYDTHYFPVIGNLCTNQFSYSKHPNWVFFNTFDKLENEVINWMKSQQWPVKTIGPIIPSMYLDKRLEDDRDYGMSLFKPNAEACVEWLDAREPASVVYASFGSLAALGEEQMQEIAWGLKRSDRHFLWVVRDTETEKLPANFVEEMSSAGKCLLVGWCNQLEVLAHGAVGCFMTHCGWNSTLEALSLGVPMVAVPQWTDQTTNAKFVADVWGAGTRAKANERGIVTRDEVELRIREVMEGEKGSEIRKNALGWKQLAKEAVDEGGSSDKHIEEFVAELIRN